MSKIIRLYFVLLFFMVAGRGTQLSGQTPLVTGNINRYARVTSVGPDYVIAEDITDFAVGDTVMIMQMSGVRINASQTLPGNYQNTVGTPGRYEFLIISAINGGTNRVSFSRNLLNTYDPLGKVQIIKVRSYSNAVVNSELTCQDWDSASVKGGVLAFMVKGVLTLNADINVGRKGFIGGKVAQGAGYCQTSDDSVTYESYSIWTGASGYKG
ncbi:MAG TPA: hypothetical protein VFB86_06075, partial [Bacteroidales bacterium]|nr:hypothetical protein [Bacteroidales bacterium]